MSSRVPGPLCQELNAWVQNVDDGTSTRGVSPKPGPIAAHNGSLGGHVLKSIVTLICPPPSAAAAAPATGAKKKSQKKKSTETHTATSHVLEDAESYIGNSYENPYGFQCAAFAQAEEVAHAPHTSLWEKGEHIEPGKLPAKGTWVATFVNDKYKGHVGVFDSMDEKGNLTLIDQWEPRNQVDRTTYHVKKNPDKISNDPTKYYVVKW